jgi:antitoxin MazE
MRSEIKRWGNSAAVRLPRKLLAEARLEVSSPVSIAVKGKKIIIEAEITPRPKRLRLPFTETDLISSLSPETAHADELAIPLDSEIGD